MRVRVRIPMGVHTFLDPNSYFPESSIGRGAGAGRALDLARALGLEDSEDLEARVLGSTQLGSC